MPIVARRIQIASKKRRDKMGPGFALGPACVADLGFDQNRPGVRSGDTPATVCSNDISVLSSKHAHAWHAFLWFEGEHHPFHEGFIESIRDHRRFIDLQSDTMPEEANPPVSESHEVRQEFGVQVRHGTGVDL